MFCVYLVIVFTLCLFSWLVFGFVSVCYYCTFVAFCLVSVYAVVIGVVVFCCFVVF